MGNAFKTAFLLTLMTLLLLAIGRYFGGQNGMILALVFAAVMNFVSYFFSDKIALAMYRAQPVTREELPRAYEIVMNTAFRLFPDSSASKGMKGRQELEGPTSEQIAFASLMRGVHW